MAKESSELEQVLRDEYSRIPEDVAVFPSILADRAYARIDPSERSPLLVRWAAILELRQLARGICRERFTVEEKEAEDTSQGLLFNLQKRYPARRGDEDGYFPLAQLTYGELQHNIRRLRNEAGAKIAHADALQAYTDTLIATGQLQVTN